MIGAFSSAGIALAGMIGIWWKFSTENRGIKSTLSTYAEKLKTLELTKASQESMLKLAELIDKLQIDVIAHHNDVLRHRNADSEKRFDDLLNEFKALKKENSDSHEKITDLIRTIGK